MLVPTEAPPEQPFLVLPRSHALKWAIGHLLFLVGVILNSVVSALELSARPPDMIIIALLVAASLFLVAGMVVLVREYIIAIRPAHRAVVA